MKVRLLLLFIVLPLLSVSAQADRSGFIGDLPEPQLLIERLKANKKVVQTMNATEKSGQVIYIPLKVHLVAKSDGTGKVDPTLALKEICDLNENFIDVGMQFYLKDGFNEFNHTPTYEFTTFEGAMNRMQLEKDDNAVNVFFLKNARTENDNSGNVLGAYFHNPYDLVTVRKNEVGIDALILAHELGHFFSLPHTYRGWDNDPWTEEEYGKQVTATRIFSSSSGWIDIEVVARTNCDNAGDLLCDTPPDYFFSFFWDNDCPPFDLGVSDRNGDTIQPPMINFMSNFLGCEIYEFSPSQINIMLADYESSNRSYIRSSYVPNSNPIVQETKILSPGFNETVPFFNSVEVAWNPVEHADHYYLSISGGGEVFDLFTDDTSINISTLQANTSYTLTILPFNESGGCADKEATVFKTTDTSTAVEDPDYVRDVHVFPNPLNQSMELNLQFSSDVSLEGLLQIIDYSGQKITEDFIRVNPGLNNHKKNVTKLNPGLYILILQAEQGSLIRRFIIN